MHIWIKIVPRRTGHVTVECLTHSSATIHGTLIHRILKAPLACAGAFYVEYGWSRFDHQSPIVRRRKAFECAKTKLPILLFLINDFFPLLIKEKCTQIIRDSVTNIEIDTYRNYSCFLIMPLLLFIIVPQVYDHFRNVLLPFSLY